MKTNRPKHKTDSTKSFRLARLFVQFINGILTGPMSRNTQAYNVLRESLTLNCYLRYDEVSLILENIFRQLNQEDDDSASNAHHSLNQSAVRVRNIVSACQ